MSAENKCKCDHCVCWWDDCGTCCWCGDKGDGDYVYAIAVQKMLHARGI